MLSTISQPQLIIPWTHVFDVTKHDGRSAQAQVSMSIALVAFGRCISFSSFHLKSTTWHYHGYMINKILSYDTSNTTLNAYFQCRPIGVIMEIAFV